MENAQYASVECKDLASRTHLLRSIRGHKDIKEAYRLTAPGGDGGTESSQVQKEGRRICVQEEGREYSPLH